MNIRGLFGFQLLDLAAPSSACPAKASVEPGEGEPGDSALSSKVGFTGEGTPIISPISAKVEFTGEGGDVFSA